jgi:prolyl-tRNA editing enzyme YbaK/EbsC (Cys-tRNA(Pro) deacylase)/RimJ/RimL family protein N-acetyltransferase
MSVQRVKEFFAACEMEERVWEFATSLATVELAAQTLCVRPARIAKTLSFKTGDGCVLVVAAGDARIDNKKYKAFFGTKAKMLAFDEVAQYTGSVVGGVCPFALPEGVPVYLDRSLQRFATVFPACGSDNSAIELTCGELFRLSFAKEWIDVCKDWAAGDDSVIDSVPKEDLSMPDDGEITLAIERIAQANEKTGHVPAYHFTIVRKSDGAHVGAIDLRLGYVRNTYYGGNIGYTVHEPYRGHAYAQKAVRLVFEVARMHRMPYLIVSCSETNNPSRKTLERLGGVLLETGEPPSYTGLYKEGLRDAHCIFRFELNG